MQGIKNWIPTPTKIAYLQQLLRVGFHTLDCGSFVSPKAIPQMADTAEVLQGLDLGETNTRISVIVANLRGAETACSFPQVDYLGFPFSISENFQMRNTHKTIDDSYTLLQQIQEKALAHNKQLIVYLSMGFGNPYGDPWSPEIVEEWIYKLAALDLPIISLSDTVGTASQDDIRAVFSTLIPRFPISNLALISIRSIRLGMKRLTQPSVQDVPVLTVPSRDMAVALWPKMNWSEICQPKN